MTIPKRMLATVVALAVAAVLALVPGLGTTATAASQWQCQTSSQAWTTALQQANQAKKNVKKKAKKVKKAKRQHASKAKVKKAKKALKNARANLRQKTAVAVQRRAAAAQACRSTAGPGAPGAPGAPGSPGGSGSVGVSIDLSAANGLFDQLGDLLGGDTVDPTMLTGLLEQLINELSGLLGGTDTLPDGLDPTALTGILEQLMTQLSGLLGDGGGELPVGILEQLTTSLDGLLDQLGGVLGGGGGLPDNPLCTVLPIPVLC